ncbi:hypothetical protein Goari_003312 [Gossypium aridum]|uniref:Uncharacterized protein n=1 Tax=Gossypium aridum TaxID=34290 RepID=A0A7J8YB75_GOSAI|nr:hypothetical protein [Gossypium aridum]
MLGTRIRQLLNDESLLNTRSKAYLLLRLWYLRVNVIQARDLVPRVRRIEILKFMLRLLLRM